MRPQQTAKKYSEKEYRKFDADLRNGVENPKFISFISKAVTECDAVVDEVSPMVSEEDAKVLDFVLDCMPDEMTPETKNYFVEYMNQMGLPKSIAQCTISAVSKEYSLRALLKMAFTEDRNINTIFKIMGRRCISE